MALTIVADIQAASGKEAFLQAELQKLIEPTRKEAGCLQYDLHVDNEKSGHFLFFENWQTRELWQDHMSSAHLSQFKAATEGAVESVTIHEMSQIG